MLLPNGNVLTIKFNKKNHKLVNSYTPSEWINLQGK